jgi:hypothetical protein
MDHTTRQQIAERIRMLIDGQNGGDIAAAALRCNIAEWELRSACGDAPHPTVDVLAAVVVGYGVDPSWLLSGGYHGGSHGRALDDPRGARATVMRLFRERDDGGLARPRRGPA